MELTDGVEDDTSLQVHDIDLLFHWGSGAHWAVGVAMTMSMCKTVRGRCRCLRGLVVVGNRWDFRAGTCMLLLAPLHKPSTEVVDEERQHKSGHEDSSCGTFVL